MLGKKVVVAADDVYPAVRVALEFLRNRGYEVVPLGSAKSGRPEPWAKVAIEAAEMVARGEVDWGVVVCYTGTGVSIAANKVKGIRAALSNDAATARGARLWNDANVLAMSGRLVSEVVAKEILEAWISAEGIDPTEKENIEFLKSYDMGR
ncbi:MAG: RpiB/LacA/LacB family sugar-phosphate isomerase [Acidilobaceae archaeon]|nr:RpiB/LacA/LacB family sugar-phosphate isomerase [Acidilobaceae archaeon]MDW7974860.1 RpiB/LacA/LacB family sugar-phosphate isomerase [Sulfolobales archaeon]